MEQLLNHSAKCPNEFICPINLTMMEDPVICEDGYTYERSAISNIRNGLSPMTRQIININNLIPNRALKDSIERFKAEYKTINVDTSIVSNDQLIIPECIVEEIKTRSPWNDKIYQISKKISPENWTDKRVATTLIAVLDTSGSMGESCSVATDGERDGFSRLNLVQHSMNTVISMLDHGDELVIVQFNSLANYIFNDVINLHNKNLAKSVIDSLVPRGGTYVWNGLKLAYDAVLNAKNNNVHIMLLTDGQSNDSPFDELKRYMERSNDQKVRSTKLTTFGFSYDINSKTLFDIAEYTNAGFNFIPDASMVGTCFCNYLANILCPDLFVTTVKEIDGFSYTKSFDELNHELQYELIRYNCYEMLKEICLKSGTAKILSDDIKNIVSNFSCLIQQLNVINTSPELVNVIKDFVSIDENQEQITKAISRQDWFTKWGYHYLLSLSLAHLTKQCHNFKDQGVQMYGNTLFNELKQIVYDMFITIPPPKPHLHAQVVRSDMSSYVNRSGGCFGPNCRIKLMDGSMIPLNKLTGYEMLYGGNKIKYIVITKIPTNKMSMCQIGNLIISNYHPLYDVKSRGWLFPVQLVNSMVLNMDCMYNIVLESGHWVEIENYRCVTLGHNLKNFDSSNYILQHEYFGTSKVINDIEKNGSFDTNNNKIVVLNDNIVYRDNKTNMVVGIANSCEIVVC
jgi:hypothetical protein